MWILTVCTAGWIMCGSHTEYEYPNKGDCYEAREALMERPQDFNYVVCAPKQKE